MGTAAVLAEHVSPRSQVQAEPAGARRARGHPSEALESYERALALKPAFVDALNNRGSALKDLGRFDEALESFDRALALKPDLATAHYNRGALLSALKRHDDALASY